MISYNVKIVPQLEQQFSLLAEEKERTAWLWLGPVKQQKCVYN